MHQFPESRQLFFKKIQRGIDPGSYGYIYVQGKLQGQISHFFKTNELIKGETLYYSE